MILTETEQLRLVGIRENLRVRGRAMVTNTGESVVCTVSDEPGMIAEPEPMARAEEPVYSVLTCLAGALKNPRAIETFTDAAGKVYWAAKYVETTADRLVWTFKTEAQRQQAGDWQ